MAACQSPFIYLILSFTNIHQLHRSTPLLRRGLVQGIQLHGVAAAAGTATGLSAVSRLAVAAQPSAACSGGATRGLAACSPSAAMAQGGGPAFHDAHSHGARGGVIPQAKALPRGAWWRVETTAPGQAGGDEAWQEVAVQSWRPRQVEAARLG